MQKGDKIKYIGEKDVSSPVTFNINTKEEKEGIIEKTYADGRIVVITGKDKLGRTISYEEITEDMVIDIKIANKKTKKSAERRELSFSIS